MRKLLGCIVAGMLLLAVTAAQSGAQVLEDSVTGSGNTSSLVFDLDARSGPVGENPAGVVRVGLVGNPLVEVRGPVTCLTVTGNHAVIGMENSLGLPLVGPAAFVEVTDGGTSDSLQLLGAPQPPTVCPATLSSFEDQVLSGDITVVDAPALPTAKDQCKNGGWQTFGFKNQGDCVSFVATKGKNPPANRP
jgi:hypothetical protein